LSHTREQGVNHLCNGTGLHADDISRTISLIINLFEINVLWGVKIKLYKSYEIKILIWWRNKSHFQLLGYISDWFIIVLI
jgi:hypothetical protein